MIFKKISPKGRSVRVVFEIPLEEAHENACVVGNFNDWDVTKHPMQRNTRKGVWTKAVSFKPGTKIQFRYFLDGYKWYNEPEADFYEPNPHYSDDCVLAL